MLLTVRFRDFPTTCMMAENVDEIRIFRGVSVRGHDMAKGPQRGESRRLLRGKGECILRILVYKALRHEGRGSS